MTRARLAVTMLFVLTSCSFYNTSFPVYLDFPKPPRTWDGTLSIVGFVVHYPGVGGAAETQFFSVEDRAEIVLPKAQNVPIVGYPVFSRSYQEALPCGALFPLQLAGNGSIALRWEDGFVAELLLRLQPDTRHLGYLNAARLCREVVKVSDGDPWLIDDKLLAESIVYGFIQSAKIRRLPTRDLKIPLDEGPWLSDDPLSAEVLPVSNGMLRLDGLPIGLHRYFQVGSGKQLLVQVGIKEWLTMDPFREDARSGSW